MAKYIYNVRVEANEYAPLEELLDKAGYDSELLETYEGDEDDGIIRGLDNIQKKFYLVIYMGEVDYPYEVLRNLEVIPETKLVETVKTMIEEERINPDLFEDAEEGEYDVENMDVAMAIKILEDDGYTVQEHII